jgi:hypothetical protein
MRQLLSLAALALCLCMLAGCKGEDRDQDIPLTDVPPAVMKTARDKLPDVEFTDAWKTRKGNYEVRGKTKEGKVRDVQVTPSGQVVEVD